jgi:hypothetical protein
MPQGFIRPRVPGFDAAGAPGGGTSAPLNPKTLVVE